MRLPRFRTLLTPLIGAVTTLSVLAPPAHAKDIPPTGAGDLLPAPKKDNPIPKGEGTLYEEYGDNLSLWILDTDYGVRDFYDAIHWIAELLMKVLLLVTRGVIVIVEWMYELLDIPELNEPISSAISGAAGGLMATLLPAALAVGGIVAFAGNKQARGSQLSQLAWVAVSAIFSISLLTSASVWVSGLDTTRTLGAEVASKAGSAGMGDGVNKFPFELDHEPTFTDDDHDNMMRKSADAIWRTYGATPWCLAEFGSMEVCEKYALGLLKTGETDTKKRKEAYLHKEVSGPNVGDASVAFRQGKSPVDRILISLIGLIAVLAFAALVVALAFASVASLLAALMLLVSGVFFACLWCIPGRPRQWGVKWFDFLVGFALQSAIAVLILSTLLVIQASLFQLMGEFGWTVTAILMIVAALAAWRFRKILESIVGVSGMGPGAMIAGLLAARGAGKLASSLGRGLVKFHVPPARGPNQPRPWHGRGRPGGTGEPGSPNPQQPTLPPGAGSGIPRRPLPSQPSGGAAEPLPRGTQPAAIGGSPTGRPGLPPGQAAGGGRSVADGPPPQRSVPAHTTRTRPQVTGAPDRPGLPAGTQPARAGTQGAQSVRPSPTLRSGQSDPSNYNFRQGPRPGTAAPRVVRGTVLNRTDRPIGHPSGPTRPRQTSRRTAPSAATSGRRAQR